MTMKVNIKGILRGKKLRSKMHVTYTYLSLFSVSLNFYMQILLNMQGRKSTKLSDACRLDIFIQKICCWSLKRREIKFEYEHLVEKSLSVCVRGVSEDESPISLS